MQHIFSLTCKTFFLNFRNIHLQDKPRENIRPTTCQSFSLDPTHFSLMQNHDKHFSLLSETLIYKINQAKTLDQQHALGQQHVGTFS